MDKKGKKDLVALHRNDFDLLVSLVLKWRKKINITALSTRAEIYRELIEDSLAPLEFDLVESPVLDAGCGAGFPTLPLAVILRDVNFTSVDSSRKKINFLKNALRALGLSNVKPVRGRLEELSNLRSTFKTVLSKAFLPPIEAVKFLRSFVAPEGRIVVYTTREKAEAAARAISSGEVMPYSLSDGRRRALLVFTP